MFNALHHTADGGHTNILLATFDSPSVSPYRVNTGYRRPVGRANTTDSDLGYSTMTPHEDSEIASTSCVEPSIIGRDRYRPKQTSPKLSADLPTIPPPPTPSRHNSDSGGLSSDITCTSPVTDTTTLLSHTGSRLPVTEEEACEGQTLLSPHQVLAPVEVHMVSSQS